MYIRGRYEVCHSLLREGISRPKIWGRSAVHPLLIRMSLDAPVNAKVGS
jgi:hypothetical protein